MANRCVAWLGTLCQKESHRPSGDATGMPSQVLGALSTNRCGTPPAPATVNNWQHPGPPLLASSVYMLKNTSRPSAEYDALAKVASISDGTGGATMVFVFAPWRSIVNRPHLPSTTARYRSS